MLFRRTGRHIPWDLSFNVRLSLRTKLTNRTGRLYFTPHTPQVILLSILLDVGRRLTIWIAFLITLLTQAKLWSNSLPPNIPTGLLVETVPVKSTGVTLGCF